MPTYGVKLKMIGTIYIEVEADDEDSALDKAVADAMFEHVEDWDVTKKDADVEELS